MRTWFLAVCLLPLVLAGCSKSADGKDVASVSSAAGAAAPSATPSLSLLDQGVRYARCMREHGVPMPDPVVVNGDGIRFQGAPKDSMNADALPNAEAACKRYRPVLPAADLAAKREFSRQTAVCMREHGVENFPDPEPDGHFEVKPSVENDPQFPAAKETCDKQEADAVKSARP